MPARRHLRPKRDDVRARARAAYVEAVARRNARSQSFVQGALKNAPRAADTAGAHEPTGR